MQNETSDEVDADVSEWAAGAHRNAAELALALGVTQAQYAEDPLSLLPNLQNYVDRLPLGEFEQSDWITLHTDLTSFLGDLLVRRREATWAKVDDPSSPARYRYFIETRGRDGKVYRVEPYDVVMEEFEHLPIEIGRLIANAEESLHVATNINESTSSQSPLGDGFTNDNR
ncbi:hypothetical protein ACFYQ5_08735 [Streptomyces sp. NPDC005794]|uniref:hypothetical protein n=1 Tax=Streptomyces sp. NPDC005794 TaxID=3364733 RepID=UPI00368F6322